VLSTRWHDAGCSFTGRDARGRAVGSGCTGYDCEFVVLARDLDIKLVTLDRQILKCFPGTAIALSEFRPGSSP
jgi:hypothetical protein